jgi:hypothetical protein
MACLAVRYVYGSHALYGPISPSTRGDFPDE